MLVPDTDGGRPVHRGVFVRACDRPQTGEKVVEQMERLMAIRGVPESITTDNGGEFTGKAMETWAYQTGVKLDFIRPGKPVENGYIESFYGRLRDDRLNGRSPPVWPTPGRRSKLDAGITTSGVRIAR